MLDPFDNSPLVRADFGDDEAWRSLLAAATSESPDGFRAELRIVDDERLAGRSTAELLGEDWHGAAVLFVADRQSLTNPERPILCVDLLDQPGRSFRCIPSELWGVENNLRLANMDWDDFATVVDDNGIHRGFE